LHAACQPPAIQALIRGGTLKDVLQGKRKAVMSDPPGPKRLRAGLRKFKNMKATEIQV
jgi:hypothetical protein